MRFGWIAAGTLTLAMTSASHAQTPAPKEIKVPILSATGQEAGFATFKTVKNGVKVKVELKNLPFGPHGVHIHQNAVCDAPDFKTAGPHFNPDAKQHGFMNAMGHHNGDFPDGINIGENHMGSGSFTLTTISLDPAAPNSLFLNGGTAIIIHEKGDDEKTDPSGNSGNRIACGVIKN